MISFIAEFVLICLMLILIVLFVALPELAWNMASRWKNGKNKKRKELGSLQVKLSYYDKKIAEIAEKLIEKSSIMHGDKAFSRILTNQISALEDNIEFFVAKREEVKSEIYTKEKKND
jgi:hypothetical protein